MDNAHPLAIGHPTSGPKTNALRIFGCLLALLTFAALLPVAAPARADEPVLYVEDPKLLAALDDKGYGFAGLFGVEGDGNLAKLAEASPAYRQIVETIGADLGELRREINEGGRSLDEFTTAETGRIMDLRWLTAKEARLRLVGVVNRLDRRDFHALRGEGGCGEVRLIYRLAYSFRRGGKGKVLSSRMPFNFNAVYDVAPDADGGCTGVAGRWQPQTDENVDAGWLAGGPLDPSELKLRQLELNAQVVRFPSGQEPEFGGQAVYLMRIFGIDGDSVVEKPLENTPDIARLESDAGLVADLATYVRENVAAIDQGVYQMPDRFLAKMVLSWSTFGAARPVNHPFSGVFEQATFADLDLSKTTLAKTSQGLLARLDNGTCQGCHQSSGTAGFHVIGLDDDQTSPLNRVEVGISPHLDAELPRRAAYVRAVAEDREPNRFRPLSFAPRASWPDDGSSLRYDVAGAAMPCIAEGDDAHLAGGWSCGAGTACTPLAGTPGLPIRLAQCLVPEKSAELFSGHPCLAGPVTPSEGMPFGDRYRVAQFAAFAPKASARDYTCRPPKIGVPGGMAYRQCDEKDRAFAAFKAGKETPREICGLTGGKKFDLCVSTGNFDRCLAGAVQRGNRATCSADRFCRDDYICQAFPPDTPNVEKVKGIGFCSPTYFVFQMRIDNHATPWGNEAQRGLDDDQPTYRSVEVGPDEDPDDLW